MQNPSRSELGSLITKIPRPLSTMRAWMFAAGVYLAIYAVFSATSIGHLVGIAVVALIVLLIIRMLDVVRVFELGLESRGTRLRWDKVAAYRLSWHLGAQKIMLVEQATKRELSVFLDVFESDAFRDAVGNRANLDSLAKIGLP